MIHNDHLATPQKMTDASGVVVWSADYKPFGEATVNPSSTITNNLRFPGQYYDGELGLHYNYMRDYNPIIGRYLESDPIGNEEGNNHLYSYSTQNPIMHIDPWGLFKYQDKATPSNFFTEMKLRCMEGLLIGSSFSIGRGTDKNATGAHKTGDAADISTKESVLNGFSPCDLKTIAHICGFSRAFQHVEKKHIHVDTDPQGRGGTAGGKGWEEYIDPCKPQVCK